VGWEAGSTKADVGWGGTADRAAGVVENVTRREADGEALDVEFDGVRSRALAGSFGDEVRSVLWEAVRRREWLASGWDGSGVAMP
jgi:hypothetical protein